MKNALTKAFYHLARINLAIHRPLKIVVAGSVGKTTTKIALAQLLSTEKKVSFMDDSYNDGVGLYLSVFELKVPTRTNVISWAALFIRAVWRTISRHPRVIVLEYGISKPGDMDAMIRFARPDVTVLTAVTPEHMEYLKTIDTVGEEEVKAVRAARQFAVVNAEDVDSKYLKDVTVPVKTYGDTKDKDAYFKINKMTNKGTEVDFIINGSKLHNIDTKFITEPIIRQLTGAMLAAQLIGISQQSIARKVPKIDPTPGRLRLFKGTKDTVIIDDTANFSPVAGIVALKALKKMKVKRRIAILGNMHELGDYEDEGYDEVGAEFKGIDVLVLVGELSKRYFGNIAKKKGYTLNENLFYFDTSVEAGAFVRDKLIKKGDGVVVKGPFGGFYLEEATKRLLKNSKDRVNLTRQSNFWIIKKRKHFGKLFDV